ncbi:MAG: hypothetical protein JSS49_30560 [Planctomycetes bacterium]|nr:hypothetical protein [Planctomycetota bacterium]
MSDDERLQKESDQRTLIALAMLVFCSLALLLLVALVLPALLGIVLVIGGMILFGTTHYVVWGWWLPRYLKQWDEDDSEVD